MKVTFFSNTMNHHQLPFSLAMDRLTGGQYTFVATEPISRERLDMDYADMNKAYPFVLTTYDSPENAQRAMKLAVESDAIIVGSAPVAYVKRRMACGRLTFGYSERVFKGKVRPRFIRSYGGMLLHHGVYRKKPLYMLCASAYTAGDFALAGLYWGKAFKWGYFPEVKRRDIAVLQQQRSALTNLLWAGRLLDWKHPEVAIAVAQRLKLNGYSFNLDIIGNGVMEQQLRNMIHEKNLGDCVHMLGAMPPEKVREHMEKSDIFLFTSDFNEGWGAVLNESMNSGCAVVASHAIGAVPFLMRDGENGLIYKNEDNDSLYRCVTRLIEDPKLRDKLGRNAYQTLADTWNAETAAERFLQLSQALLDGKSPDLFEEGPCSRAEILRNGWYR